jgi:predicted metal-dependent hydrolase
MAETRITPFPFEFTILRSRRRSISIEVQSARVVIRAPMRVAESALYEFLHEKNLWVQEKIREQQQALAAIPQHTYMAGSRMPYLGGEITLVLGSGSAARVVLHDQQLHVLLSRRRRMSAPEQTRRLVQAWYQQQALVLLTDKTTRLATTMGLQHTGVSTRATRTKWGHCTSRGAIQYNWQIILAPEPIVDYLVAHEVSHLRHHNHSRAFWQLVESVCPDYVHCRAWLKAHGQQLVL